MPLSCKSGGVFFMQDIKKILELRSKNQSIRAIARMLRVSRNTIGDIYNIADEKNVTWESVKDLSDHSVNELFKEKTGVIDLAYVQPDFEMIHKELLKPSVTLQLLWEEYADSCKKENKPFYQRSNFYRLYGEYVMKHKLTMHINHKPADKLMVDWDGKCMFVNDRYTGEITKAYIFVATLPFSMYSYVQACPTMNINDWIDCHVKAYRYFGGVARLLIPDNLKVGVISHKRYEDPILNKSYQEMADFYDTSILPARVKAPKDKSAVEGTVGDITNFILGRLRNRTFFSFDELNKAILIELDKFNKKPFQKREGSRYEVFKDEESDFLKPLPKRDFEVSNWKMATVQLNYHISIEKMNYSVPYEYVGKRVEVKLTKSTIEVFYKGKRICTHNRLIGRKGQYSTNTEHMPENHQLYTWNGERFRKWALSIGPNTYQVVDQILNRGKVEEQGYKGCLSLLKLSDTYTAARLESACRLASDNISKPSYKNIRMILSSGQDLKKEDKTEQKASDTTYAFIRGKGYYENK